jgi:putative ABC transport system permease protein
MRVDLIACRVPSWAMRGWLNSLDARLALTLTPFLLAGLIAFVIAIGAICGHAVKVARTNPIEALRCE